MRIRSTGEDAYFAAANSSQGFYCNYSACFDSGRIHHLYAVKGGPGTGKSRFMRDVAIYGEARGFRCEYIYCSSDPDSLDGVILTRDGRGLALLDATAPHVYEPRLPGTREELVNLGVFWDSAALEKQQIQIKGLQEEKSRAYRRAYHYLAAAGALSQARDLLVEPYLRPDLLRTLAERLMEGIEGGDAFSEQCARMSSIGMQGRVALDTYFARARELVVIEDCRGTAYRLMAELRQLAQTRRCAIRVSYEPLMPERIDAIEYTACGRAFVVAPRGAVARPYRRVSMRRVLAIDQMGEVRRECNALGRTIRATVGSSIDALRDVRRAHFALEEIYSAAMNFASKETFTKIFCRELLGE